MHKQGFQWIWNGGKLAALLLFFLSMQVHAQNMGINATGANPDSSAMLDVVSTDKGVLVPRTDTTTVNGSGVTLATGLLIYQTSDNKFYYYNGIQWIGIDGADTDDQTLSLSGTNLSIANGNTVNLSSIDTDTDNQKIDALSLSGTTLSLSLEDDGVAPETVNLSSIDTDTDNQTVDVFGLSGTTLQLSIEDDGKATETVDLSSIDTDDQTLTLSGSKLSISGGNSVDVSVVDTDTDNQTVDAFSLSGTTLQLSLEDDGKSTETVNLSSLQDDLGDHKATQNIELSNNWLSNDGGSEGIRVGSTGNVGVGVAPSSGAKLEVNGTAEATDFDYASTQTRYYNIAAPAWREGDPSSYSIGDDLWDVFIDGNVTGFPSIYAPVNLPHGATITNIQAYVYDNSTLGNVDVRIYRNDWNSANLTIIMNIISTSGTPGNTTISTSTPFSTGANIIDNANYNYFAFMTCNSQSNGSNLSIRGFRITYTVASPD